MNTRAQGKKKEYSRSALRGKLLSATAMLLVSSIMMVSSTYAWFVLSTAPEVTGIKTQVGANGALEIALLNAESWNDLTLLDMGDIDESAETITVDSNLTWGNLVNLNNAAYGMDQIVLNPARLFIEQSGTTSEGRDQFTINNSILKTPIYGEDGRVTGLDTEHTIAYIHDGGQFKTEGYGVRAIGTSASMSVFQLDMNAARTGILTCTAAARTTASKALSANGNDLAAIVVDYAAKGKENGYTVADITAIKTMAVGMDGSLDQIELALRQAFAGYITTENCGLTADTYPAAKEYVNNSEHTLSDLMDAYPGITGIIPKMGDYITKLGEDQANVDTAAAQCQSLIDQNRTYTWTEISNIIRPLMDINQMTVNGKTVTQLKGELMDANGSIKLDAAMSLVSGGITITAPAGSGLLCDIADFAGDYTASVTASVDYQGQSVTAPATITTQTAQNPVYLTACSNALKTATVAAATGNATITDFYGYAIDLVFRTNAERSELLLQTEPQNRVYEGDTENAALQGGGSYMRFTTSAGLSATKMVKLMKGIRVVLMDEKQNVLGIAALDCTLGKDKYTELTAEEKSATGMYAYLNGLGTAYQVSDMIAWEDYSRLPDTSAVVFDETTGEVTAKLYLYNFALTESATSTPEETRYTGGITIEDKRTGDAGRVITALQQDIIQRVTAVVYLDGSFVNNATVASEGGRSVSGTLNLQFASTAPLTPAENTALRTGESDTQTSTEPTT